MSSCTTSDAVEQFHFNPVGFTVLLWDGKTHDVRGFIDTPRGRWLRVGFCRWIPADEVEAVCTHHLYLTELP